MEVVNKKDGIISSTEKLFFINFGGCKQNEFEEFHYKLQTVTAEKGTAIQKARQTAFYRHTGFEGATSNINDRFGIDVDDIYEFEDILPSHLKDNTRFKSAKRKVLKKVNCIRVI